mmetsp:Transcript_6033/g.18603  ORF Transcript_6033/g.18603 Transcript_6033/m.18603 type:complete len:245 (-) Transcript_6033:41-775(-)
MRAMQWPDMATLVCRHAMSSVANTKAHASTSASVHACTRHTLAHTRNPLHPPKSKQARARTSAAKHERARTTHDAQHTRTRASAVKPARTRIFRTQQTHMYTPQSMRAHAHYTRSHPPESTRTCCKARPRCTHAARTRTSITMQTRTTSVAARTRVLTGVRRQRLRDEVNHLTVFDTCAQVRVAALEEGVGAPLGAHDARRADRPGRQRHCRERAQQHLNVLRQQGRPGGAGGQRCGAHKCGSH